LRFVYQVLFFCWVMHASKKFFYYSWANMTRFSASICILPSRPSTLTYAYPPTCLSFFSTRCLSPPYKLTRKKHVYRLFFFVLFSFLNKFSNFLSTFAAYLTVKIRPMSFRRLFSPQPTSLLNSHLSLLPHFTQTITSKT